MDAFRTLPMILLVFATLFSPLSAKNPNASLEESLELRKIAEYWKEKDYKTVGVQIREFLNKHPESGYIDQLYAMLGDLYFQEKNFSDAAAAYDKIQGKEFRQKSQFNRLCSLYEIGKYDPFILASECFLRDPSAKVEQINAIRFALGEIYFCKGCAPENGKNKKELMKAALAEYSQVMQTKYCDQTLLPQAQIFTFLEEYQKAASLFALLSQKDQSKKEEYLFQVASSQLHFDKGKAIETFGSIYEINGKNGSKAAFNQLNLLFQEKRYTDFILAYDKAVKYISTDKRALVQYYLGKSLFLTRDYSKAIEPLTQSLASKTLDATQEKSTLITLIAVAKETQDLTLFEKALSTLKVKFGHDEETGNILLMCAQLCRDKKEWSKARSYITELLDLNPGHQQREALLYDTALLLSQEEKWQEAAAAFEALLKEFPQYSHCHNALRQIVFCRVEDAKRASLETDKVKKEQLLTALNTSMREKQSFTSLERQKLRYLLAKTQFELGKFDESIGNLSEYVKDFSKDATCAEAYLLLAYAHQKIERDDIHFVLNAEKALALNPKLQGTAELHLTLFNTYLGLAGKAPSDEKREMIGKAAEHLFFALDKPVNRENQRWLASYYYEQYQNGKEGAAQRATYVLEKLLDVKENLSTLSIAPQGLEKEGETLKLAELYRKTNRFKDCIQLLEALNKEQKTHSDFQWKYQRMAQFELGKAYLAIGEKEKAQKSFKELISSSSHVSSYFALAAAVEKAKLDFSLLKMGEKYENSSAVQAICNTLKDLQIKRKLHSEPIHLEAALCYVECKSGIAQEADRKKRAIFLLEKLKENFSASDDPLVQQYFSAAAQFPDKQRLCQQYLTFVDLEIQRLNAEETHDDLLFHKTQERLDQLLTQTTEDALIQRILKSKAKVL
jgi:tetratricopeptide (TPR) repeat protein